MRANEERSFANCLCIACHFKNSSGRGSYHPPALPASTALSERTALALWRLSIYLPTARWHHPREENMGRISASIIASVRERRVVPVTGRPTIRQGRQDKALERR